MYEKTTGLLIHSYSNRLAGIIQHLEADLGEAGLPRAEQRRYTGKNLCPGLDTDPAHWTTEAVGPLIALAELRQFQESLDNAVALFFGEQQP